MFAYSIQFVPESGFYLLWDGIELVGALRSEVRAFNAYKRFMGGAPLPRIAAHLSSDEWFMPY